MRLIDADTLYEKLQNDSSYDLDFFDSELREVIESIPTVDEKNGWILCSERFPSKEECGSFGRGEFQVTIPQHDGNKTTVMDYEYTNVRGKEISRWKWDGRLSPWEVIAWKPLSEPYQK